MKLKQYIVLVCLWLAWLLAGPATALSQGTFVYQQWINPNPRTNVPWDDSGVWVGPGYLGAGTPLNIDMDLDGTVDFQISSDGTTLGIFATGNGEVIALRSTPPDLGGFTARLPAGQPINSLAPVPYEWVESYYFYGPIGTALLASNTAGQLGFWGGRFGYLGVRIWRNDAWNYGWIRGGVPLSIVPEGIFYEAALNLNPNAGIFTGQVPEPGAFTLLLLSGAAFWLVRKRL
jgi:hypothetical protein